MTSAPPPGPATTTREPEIEFLGKVVRFGLVAFRAATVTAGAVSVVYALLGIFAPAQVTVWMPTLDEATATATEPIAPSFVWLCVGIPPLLPTGWLFGRGRWLMLAVGLALWGGPHWLEGDAEYGYLIRFFATLVALSVLVVWKTIFALTKSTLTSRAPDAQARLPVP